MPRLGGCNFPLLRCENSVVCVHKFCEISFDEFAPLRSELGKIRKTSCKCLQECFPMSMPNLK